MSKQPRGSVRISQGNTGGARVSNIFADLEKFQTRFYEMKQKASKRGSKVMQYMVTQMAVVKNTPEYSLVICPWAERNI